MTYLLVALFYTVARVTFELTQKPYWRRWNDVFWFLLYTYIVIASVFVANLI